MKGKNTMRKTTEQEQQVLQYLNKLRDSGITNMFGAVPYIVNRFSISKSEASDLLTLWIDNFSEDSDYSEVKHVEK